MRGAIFRRPMRLLWFSLLCVGCQTGVREGVRPAEMRAEVERAAPFLLPVEALSDEFVLRQKVTVRWRGEAGATEAASFDAAIQRQGDSLLLLGLGPMGQVGFTLGLKAGQVEFENRTGRALPFEPARMLADVQRVYYPWFDRPASCLACVRRTRREGFAVEESRAAGRVVTRIFTWEEELPGAQGGRVVVRFSEAPEAEALARDVTLRNERFGYEVDLDTLSLDWID